MAAITIRNLPDEVVEALKRRAKANGRSMEADVRDVLARLAATGDSGLEDVLRRDASSPRRAVPMREVMARIDANPRTPAQKRLAREWAAELDADKQRYAPSDEDFLDPWERAELHVQRLRREQDQ